MNVRGLAEALLATVLARVSTAAAAQWSVSELMAALAARGGGEAQFTERRYVPVLDAPVLSSGTLRFVAPDRIEKHAVTPRAHSIPRRAWPGTGRTWARCRSSRRG